MGVEALNSAVQQGDIDAVENMLSSDPGLLEARSEMGWTPLIVASFHGHDGIIRQLLAHGANPNFTNPKGTTPLMYAKGHFLRTGDAQPMQILLRAGADPNIRDKAGLLLLEYVPEERRAEISAILSGRPAS